MVCFPQENIVFLSQEHGIFSSENIVSFRKNFVFLS